MGEEKQSGRIGRLVPSNRLPTGDSDDQLANPWIAAAAVLLVVLIPLLPFLFVAWMLSRTLQGVRERVSWE